MAFMGPSYSRALRRAAASFVALVLSGCGMFADHELRRPNFSPNGEPLVGAGWPRDCRDALALWFERVDANHDGVLTLAEYQADALRQYEVMDLRHDGRVTAAEVASYRQKVMGSAYQTISTPEAALPRRASGRRNDPFYDRDDSDRPSVSGYIPAEMPDPIMSADTDLDGSVTVEEFRIYVLKSFTAFDRAHNGGVGKSDIQRYCESWKE